MQNASIDIDLNTALLTQEDRSLTRILLNREHANKVMHDGENARSASHFQINRPPAFLLDSRCEAIEHIGNKAIETDGLYQHGLIGE